MYKEKFEPLTEAQIKLLNKQGLATSFKCSHTYVNRVLRFTQMPIAPKAEAILKTAHDIVETLEKQAAIEAKRLEVKDNN